MLEALVVCSILGLALNEAKIDEIPTYSESGKYRYGLDPKYLLPATIIECNNPLGLVKIRRGDGATFWVDPINFKLGSGHK